MHAAAERNTVIILDGSLFRQRLRGIAGAVFVSAITPVLRPPSARRRVFAAQEWYIPTPSEGRQKRRQRGAGCGPVKARFQRSRSRKTGSRGVPGRTPCSPHGAARYSALYRPDNRTRKCPARFVGAGHFSWARKPPQRRLPGFTAASLRRVPHGRAVCEKALVHRRPTISTKGVLCDALRHYAL